MSTATDERRLVKLLGQKQLEKLSLHRDRSHWATWGRDRFYIERLIGEVLELQEVLLTGRGDAWSEAGDIANFAAMLADRHDRRDRMAEPEYLRLPECRATHFPEGVNVYYTCNRKVDHAGRHQYGPGGEVVQEWD